MIRNQQAATLVEALPYIQKFTGKTIVSFSSHGGTMFGDSVSDLCKTVPGAYVGLAYEFNYSGWDEGEIADWLMLNGIAVK